MQTSSPNGKENNTNQNRQQTPTKIPRGSGLKEIAGWEERHMENHIAVSLKSASSPTNRELVKEVASNWEVAKQLGVTCCDQEEIMVGIMVGMEERDMGEVQRMGSNEVD